MEIADIRRQNLRDMMKREGAATLAERLGYRQSSFLSQMAGPNPTREVTEKTVRAYEKQLGMAPGTLDKPLDEGAEVKPPSTEDMIALVLNATRTVGRICETESVNLQTHKFADIVALAIVDTLEHGGKLREDRIKQVVCLLK